MTDLPLVSVLVTCFNDGAFLGEAVESALAQSYPAVEVIISDDGSTDAATLAALDRHEASGVIVLRNAHAGISANRNAALAAASGEFLCFLDADDRLTPQHVALCLECLLACPGAGIVAPDTRLFGAARGIGKTRFEIGRMLAGNQLPQGCLVRRSDLLAIGGYCLDLRTHEDWDVWLGLLEMGRTVELLGQPTYLQRIHDAQISHTMTAEANPPIFAAIMRRHAGLYEAHAEDFWRALLAERAVLYQLSGRYGRLNALVHAGVHHARRLKRAKRD